VDQRAAVCVTPISVSNRCAPSTLSIVHSMKRLSTWIVRLIDGSYSQSETTPSSVPSNASPTNSPRALSVEEPELPLVMSTVDRKSTGSVPSSGET
jgi:hypothetical protein